MIPGVDMPQFACCHSQCSIGARNSARLGSTRQLHISLVRTFFNFHVRLPLESDENALTVRTWLACDDAVGQVQIRRLAMKRC